MWYELTQHHCALQAILRIFSVQIMATGYWQRYPTGWPVSARRRLKGVIAKPPPELTTWPVRRRLASAPPDAARGCASIIFSRSSDDLTSTSRLVINHSLLPLSYLSRKRPGEKMEESNHLSRRMLRPRRTRNAMSRFLNILPGNRVGTAHALTSPQCILALLKVATFSD